MRGGGDLSAQQAKDETTPKNNTSIGTPRGKLAESGELQAFFDREGIPFSNSGAIQTK